MTWYPQLSGSAAASTSCINRAYAYLYLHGLLYYDLLYETVPAFEDTWIECLGDLGRYRMAIEDDDPEDREVWPSSTLSRFMASCFLQNVWRNLTT